MALQLLLEDEQILEELIAIDKTYYVNKSETNILSLLNDYYMDFVKHQEFILRHLKENKCTDTPTIDELLKIQFFRERI